MAQQAYVKDIYGTQQGYDKDGYHQDNRSEAPGIPTYQPHLPRMVGNLTLNGWIFILWHSFICVLHAQ